MVMSGTSDVKLTLIPLAVTSHHPTTEDDWLENDAAELAELIESAESSSQKTIGSQTIHICDTFMFHITASGVLLHTHEGVVNVLDGECIQVGEQCFRLHIEQMSVLNNSMPSDMPSDMATKVTPLPMCDDIWSSGEELRHQAHIPDPFANRHQAPVVATARSTAATPIVNHQDPLNFLYDHHSSSEHDPNVMLPSVATQSPALTSLPQHAISSTPNYFAETGTHQTISSHIPPQSTLSMIGSAPAHTGDVLNDLGIDASRSTLTQKQYDAGKSTFLDQSPADMLDEYLSADDEHYLRQPYVQQPHQEAFRQANQQTGSERSKGWLDSVKNVVKSVHKR